MCAYGCIIIHVDSRHCAPPFHPHLESQRPPLEREERGLLKEGTGQGSGQDKTFMKRVRGRERGREGEGGRGRERGREGERERGSEGERE